MEDGQIIPRDPWEWRKPEVELWTDIRTPAMDESYVLTASEAAAGGPGGPGERRIAPGVAARADWRNARAQFLMTLNQQLESAPDDEARERLIADLMKAIGPAVQQEAA